MGTDQIPLGGNKVMLWCYGDLARKRWWGEGKNCAEGKTIFRSSKGWSKIQGIIGEKENKVEKKGTEHRGKEGLGNLSIEMRCWTLGVAEFARTRKGHEGKEDRGRGERGRG